ncbi:MAG: phage holin family protein [Thermoleophilaceae bacterium]|nr:phage holin family protein [Thermoleophilaceae bacterium]
MPAYEEDPGAVRQGDAHQGDLRERPVGELLKQLSQETTTLVRQELELAKAEMSQKGKEAGTGLGLLGGAGVSALMALIALTLCLTFLLGTFMKDWIAALIVTALWAAVAGALALQGKNKVQEAGPPVPEQTVETVKEDVQWAKTQR